MARKIQHKRGLEANLPTLAEAEWGLTTDTEKPFIGGPNGNIEIAKKKDVDEALANKANATTVQGLSQTVNAKADVEYVETELAKKADTTALETKADVTALETKADKEEVTTLSAQLADTSQEVETVKVTKADKTYVDSELAVKATKGEISASDIDKNKGKFDQTYLSDDLLQQIAGTAPVNAVPANESISNDKLVSKAVSYSKQDVFNVKDSGNIFDGTFTDFWVDTTTLVLNKQSGVVSALVKLEPQGLYEIETTGAHNMFRVGFTNNPVVGEPVLLYKNETGVLRERKAFIKNKGDYNYLLLCLNSSVYTGGSTPELSVKKLNTEMSYNREMSEEVSKYYVKEWIDYIQNTWTTPIDERSIVYPIQPNSTIKIKTMGAHNRFTVYTSNDATGVGATDDLRQIFVKQETTGNEEYEFYNTDKEFVIIGISTAGEYKPPVIISQSFTALRSSQEEPNVANDILNVNEKEVSMRNYKGTAITSIGGSYYVTQASSQSFAALIKPNTHYRITVMGSNTHFIVSTLNVELTASLLVKGNYLIDNILTTDSSLREFEFTTGSDAVDLFVFLGNASVQATVYIEEVSVDTKYPVSQKKYDIRGITDTKDIYPVMFGVKMTNERDISRGKQEPPRPIGWLYYNPVNSDILYASGSPENMKFLCRWEKSVTWDGRSTPGQYRPFITKKGDIIFVWRGDLLGYQSGLTNVRQNPIVYPAGDWDNPIEVDLGSGIKPTSWLQNSGADYIYNENVFMFSEYTRPSHQSAYVWRVTEPVTDPNNWKIVKDFPLSGDNLNGMKHCHTMSYDPFSGKTFLTTGDDDSAAKIFMSDDFGETWNVVLEGENKYSRVLNFVFTKDKVYWGTDQAYPHYFLSVDRDENGVPDFSNISILHEFTYTTTSKATYVNCLIEEHNGILILDRYDVATSEALRVHFWEIETNTMHIIKEINHLEAGDALFGFRVEAANFYQSKGDNKIVVGFGDPINNMDVVGNTIADNTSDRINNLVLEVVKDGSTFDLKLTAINNRI